jgi:aryl carrier-like protein
MTMTESDKTLGARTLPPEQVEQLLTSLWTKLLQRETIGRDENIFEAGARSLQVMLAVTRIQEALGQEISPLIFFDAPTIAAQVALFATPTEEFVL